MQNPTSSPVPSTGSRSRLLLGMIASQILTLPFSAFPLAYLLLGSIKIGANSATLDFWNLVFSLPVLNLIPMIAAWVAFARRNDRLALQLTVLTLALALLEAAGFVAMLMGNVIPR